MNSAVYSKLAITNIKNSRRMYVPYIITCIITVMMFYIIYGLTKNKGIVGAPGEQVFREMLSMGVTIVGIFSVIFLFYTNSFLMKQRKKEIGVYNILGLGKTNIAKMLMVEMCIITCISLLGGIIGGICFGKFAFLIMLKILHFDTHMKFSIEPRAIFITIILFCIIFLACLIFNLFQVKLSNPIELLHGSNQGDREPKTKKIMAIIGVVSLGVGYYLALTTESVMNALGVFFIAVILVIIGTYALFTSGSIAFLKILRKNKTYYYKTKHFTSISGMLYRMKENAVGLGNICILSTMVLIMLSSTLALYTGLEDILRMRFPKQCIIMGELTENIDKETMVKNIDKEIDRVLQKYNLKEKGEISYFHTEIDASKEKNVFETNVDNIGPGTLDVSTYCGIQFMTLEDFNQVEKRNEILGENEVICYATKGKKLLGNELIINNKRFRVKTIEMKNIDQEVQMMIDEYYFVLPNQKAIIDLLGEDKSGAKESYYKSLDFEGNKDNIIKASEELKATFPMNADNIRGEFRETEREEFFSLYGMFLFLGLFFGGLFLMATVLIIYYKQISEGYSDKARFSIMQKVGMSKQEVKSSIKSQVMSVFYLPLVFAVLHVLVAFKIITKLLSAFALKNVKLIAGTTVVTVVMFGIFYTIVFMITTKEYYRIVK
ncbi:FtsX-like permease family protein [Faecalimonas sp.]